MFGFFKTTFQKIYAQCSAAFAGIFARSTIDETALAELERILIGADTGIKTTTALIITLKKQLPAQATGAQMKELLEQELLSLLTTNTYKDTAHVYLLVGINGSGKTTTTAKLAARAQKTGKKVLLIAGDTFRAAATQQLLQWANRLGIALVTGTENQDPASVVFTGITRFKQEHFDTLIIDTAGRLQTKTNLMKELAKIKRVIATQLPTATVHTLLTIDAMLGQNSLEQAKLFHEITPLDGIILTKLDGTGKGGIVFAIAHELRIPIAFITYGEQLDHLQPFEAHSYIHNLLNL